MQIWTILGGGKEARRWDKKDFMKFPEDCEATSLFSVIREYLRKLDEDDYYFHYIVFSKAEELILEKFGKVFFGDNNAIPILGMLCSRLRFTTPNAPIPMIIEENLNPSLGGELRRVHALRFEGK